MSSSSLPRRPYDPRQLFIFPVPAWVHNIKIAHKRTIGVYLSGALFALGWWCFIDAVIQSSRSRGAEDSYGPHINFADWIGGLLATLGMVIVNLIDKGRLAGGFDEGSTTAWRARLVLFFGFSLLAGGLAGSITTLIVKYVLASENSPQAVNWGVQGVLWNVGVMGSAVVLWLAQVSGGDDYEYNINL